MDLVPRLGLGLLLTTCAVAQGSGGTWILLGSGCPGTGGAVPAIAARTDPTIGMRSWSVDLAQALPSTSAWLALGFSTTSWSGIPLPFDAGGGCLLRVGIVTGFATPVGPSGDGSYPIPLPYDPSLRGVVGVVQWLVVDPGSGSPFGVTLSPALQFTIR